MSERDTDMAEEEEANSLSFEDARPAEAVIRSIFTDAAGPYTGATPLDRLEYDAIVVAAGHSRFFVEYVSGLFAASRLDSEECFEMVILLVKKYGRGDLWQQAWPVDAYLETGPKFGGDWANNVVQGEIASWRTLARELESIGATREDIGTFASLLADAMKVCSLHWFPRLPVIFDPAIVGSKARIAQFLLRAKKITWTALYDFYRPALMGKKENVLDRWGRRQSSDLVDAFEKEVESAALNGTQRPLSPKEWEFRLSWRLMRLKFATGRPSGDAQAQYDGIVLEVEDLSKRYGIMELPQIKRSDMGYPCWEFIGAMWTALDANVPEAVTKTYDAWKNEIADTTDAQERQALKLRFGQMTCHLQAGWPYAPKSPARSKEHLWKSLKKRLVDLGMSPVLAKAFKRVENMAFILAGSGVLVEPPPLLYGVQPRDYIFEQLEPAFLEHELAYWSPAWDNFALRESPRYMERDLLVAAKARIWEEARSNGGPVWGPEQEDWRVKWNGWRDIFVGPDPSTILAGRFRDLHQDVEELAERFGEFVRPSSSLTISEYSEEDFGKLSRSVRGRMKTAATIACRQFYTTAVNSEEKPAYQTLVEILVTNINEGGPYFAPWDPPATLQTDRDPRARGSGTDRSGLKGEWRFKGNVGKGGFGQVSCWEEVDGSNNIVDRLILKESYTRSWDSSSWWVGDVNLRRPKEYFFAKYVADLPDGACFAKPKAYAIYENIKMYRLYMEYCRHGDLDHMLRYYTTDNKKALGM